MIINGDYIEKILEIKDNSIDLIITDPPYLISRGSSYDTFSDDAPEILKIKYGTHKIDFGEWDKESIDFNMMMSEFYRVLKKGGTLIVFFDVWKSGHIKEFAALSKFKQPRVGIWIKSNPVPINSKSNYLSNAHEFFFSFVKVGKPTFNSEYDKAVYHYPLCHGKERTEHPTQKPLKLFEDLIKKHSNEGDLILDPFSGSGTTAEACINTKRKFICIERDINYYKISIDRINGLQSSTFSNHQLK